MVNQNTSTARRTSANALPMFRPIPVAQNLDNTGGVLGFIRLFVFFAIPFVIVPGALPQLEMLVVGGRVPVSSAILKAIILGVLLGALLIRGVRIKSSQRLFIVALLFFGYLLIDILHFYLDVGMKISDVLIGYNGYYMLDFLAVLAILIPLQIRERQLYYILIPIAPVCALLAIAQFITNRPIIPTQSGDGNFQVLTWMMDGHIRAFGLFDGPQPCALFFVFITALLIAVCRKRKHRVWAIPLLPVSVAIVLMSYARAQLVALAWAIVVALLLTFWSGKGRIRRFPFYGLLAGVPILVYGYLTMGRSLGTHSMTTSNSFAMRIREWSFYLSVLRSIPISRLLFGLGIVQVSQAESGPMTLIDNIYLSGVAFIGIIGAILYLVLIWMVWDEIRKKAETRNSYLHTAAAATYSTFFLMGIFDLTPARLAGYAILFAISNARIIPGASEEQREDYGKKAVGPRRVSWGARSTLSG